MATPFDSPADFLKFIFTSKNTVEDVKNSYKKHFDYIETTDQTEIYNLADILSFINPLNDVPENRLLHFTFKRLTVFQLFTGEDEIEKVSRPNNITVNKITILRNKNIMLLMKNYIDDCYKYNTTKSEKYYTSCVMNNQRQLLALQITECDDICILSMAFDNQNVWYNYYNKKEFMEKFENRTFFNKYNHTIGFLDTIYNYNQ